MKDMIIKMLDIVDDSDDLVFQYIYIIVFDLMKEEYPEAMESFTIA